MYKLLALCACCAATVAVAAPAVRHSDNAQTILGGSVAGQDWGRPITSGDLDGDGHDEIIIAASESYGGVISEVSVIRGGSGAASIGYIDLSSNNADQTILGATLNDNLGSSMATGDFNGDHIDDLLICASSAGYSGLSYRGIAYLIYGGPGFFESSVRDLSDDSNWDMRIIGPVEGGDMGGMNAFGGLDAHAAAIGDITGDGYGDIVLGVHLADGATSGAGRVYVRFGGPFPSGYTLNLATASGYSVLVNGRGQYDELGTIVATGDVTGDGIDDLIMGNNYYSQGLFTSEGAVHVMRGKPAKDWSKTYSLTTPADITLIGKNPYDELGSALTVGDFNGDGLGDLACAAPGADAGAFNNQRGDGIVYGILGSSTYQSGTHTLDFVSAQADFYMIGETEENLGAELATGDFNGDDIDDIAASERFSGPNVNGVVEVLFGRDFTGNPSFTANVDTDAHILGAEWDRIGFSLWASDVDNDGVSEVVFGTPFNNAPEGETKGTVYVMTLIDGDFDGDGDLDLADFAGFQSCFTGPVAPETGLHAGCWPLDYDFDGAISLDDYTEFESRLVGP